MKFTITGADAVTGDDRWLTIDAADEKAALAAAKSQGVFVSRVSALPEPAAPSNLPSPPKPTEPPTRPPSEIEKSDLSAVFTLIAVLNFMGAVIGGFAAGNKEPVAGWIVFASGCLGGLFLLALSKVLDYLFEAVQRLRQILKLLNSKQ